MGLDLVLFWNFGKELLHEKLALCTLASANQDLVSIAKKFLGTGMTYWTLGFVPVLDTFDPSLSLSSSHSFLK